MGHFRDDLDALVYREGSEPAAIALKQKSKLCNCLSIRGKQTLISEQ